MKVKNAENLAKVIVFLLILLGDFALGQPKKWLQMVRSATAATSTLAYVSRPAAPP